MLGVLVHPDKHANHKPQIQVSTEEAVQVHMNNAWPKDNKGSAEFMFYLTFIINLILMTEKHTIWTKSQKT